MKRNFSGLPRRVEADLLSPFPPADARALLASLTSANGRGFSRYYGQMTATGAHIRCRYGLSLLFPMIHIEFHPAALGGSRLHLHVDPAPHFEGAIALAAGVAVPVVTLIVIMWVRLNDGPWESSMASGVGFATIGVTTAWLYIRAAVRGFADQWEHQLSSLCETLDADILTEAETDPIP